MYKDHRGSLFSLKNLPFEPKEILVSINYKNVFRGFHQSPYSKYIYVISGTILDFFWHEGSLNQKKLNCGESILIPAGAPHGFLVLEEANIVYLLDGNFDKNKDKNIYWKTPEYGLPELKNIIISEKDSSSSYANEYDYIVIGASGYLGQNCVKYLKLNGKNVLESRSRLENPHEISDEIRRSRAKYVICAAGISGRPTIDWCETHEDETRKTNFIDILNLMEVCKGVHLTIFGSGAVYSGNKTCYTETDPPDYTDKVYSKYRVLLEKHLVPEVLYLRIMYPCTFDSNPKCFYNKMMQRRSTVHNAKVSITPVPDLFPFISTLTENKCSGVYNFVADGPVLLGDLINTTNVSSDIPRGNYELSVEKLKKVIAVPTIKEVLVNYITEA
jgi:dTDP-4-dehydrorhamnose reductase/dTDP-4-dehydrorhamnose 3,5-epimerase-like enzyme